MTNKISFNIILFLAVVNVITAQTKEGSTKQLPSVTAGVGILTFDGDIGSGVNVSSFGRIKSGYSITLEQRIKKFIGVGVSAMYGKIADSENGKINGLNFQSEITQIDLNIFLHFDNDLILNSKSEFAPYLFTGIGFLKFNPHTDLKDKKGTYYNYWSDGSIRDLPENDPQASTADFIHRDYKYETKLTDSSTSYSRTTLAIPVGLGVTLKLTNNWGVNLGCTYYFTQSDWLDNKKMGGNDKYLFANASLKYTFGKQKADNSPIYKSVDFGAVDKTDSDGDGILDINDRCAGTPKGVKTDGKGCPLDKDEDGVPDFNDKEQTTKGAIVDENGVTITEKMLTEHQSLWDSVATERRQLFNENPTLKFLQEIDSKKLKNPNKINNIPLALKPADKDGDGLISSSEISGAIDAFFEGESPFTVEKLNDLIDYFFEQ